MTIRSTTYKIEGPQITLGELRKFVEDTRHGDPGTTVSLQGYKSMNHPTDYQPSRISVTITEVV